MWVDEIKNKDGTIKYKFVERYTDHRGKQKYVSKTMATDSRQAWNKAQSILNQKIADKLSEKPNEFESYTYKEVSEKWLELKKKTVKLSTWDNYQSNNNQMLKTLENVNMDDLTAGVINRMFMDMFNSGVCYKTVSERYKIIKNIIKYAIDYEYMFEDNISNKIRLERINVSERQDDKYLEKDEAERLFNAMIEDDEEELSDFFKLQMQTGMRFGELCGLHINDIDLKLKSIFIRYTYNQRRDLFTLPKGNKERTIHINDESVSLIKKILRRRKILLMAYGARTDLLFFDVNGKPVSYGTFSNKLHKYESEDKPLTSHIFRHTFTTRMIENNVPANLIAEHLGQSGTEMVDRVYSHFSNKMDSDLKAAINKVSV